MQPQYDTHNVVQDSGMQQNYSIDAMDASIDFGQGFLR
jgi:hypothetical protein